MPNSSSTLTWDSGAQDILRRLVTSARNSGKGTKIVLSVGKSHRLLNTLNFLINIRSILLGGWGGSTWFSQAMSSSANRTTFKNSLTSAVNSFGLDGKLSF